MKKVNVKEQKTHEDSEEPWHAIDTEVVIRRLGTDLKKRLTRSEAKHRLEKYGLNTLREEKE